MTNGSTHARMGGNTLRPACLMDVLLSLFTHVSRTLHRISTHSLFVVCLFVRTVSLSVSLVVG